MRPRSPHYALLSLFVHVPPLPLGFFDLLLVKERRFLLEALPPYLTLAGVGCAYVVFYLLFSVGMHRTNGGHHTYAFMEDLDALRPYPLGWLALALLASAGFAALTYVTWWTPQTQALDAKPPATAFPPSLAHSRAGAALLRGRGLPIAVLANMRVLNCTSLDCTGAQRRLGVPLARSRPPFFRRPCSPAHQELWLPLPPRLNSDGSSRASAFHTAGSAEFAIPTCLNACRHSARSCQAVVIGGSASAVRFAALAFLPASMSRVAASPGVSALGCAPPRSTVKCAQRTASPLRALATPCKFSEKILHHRADRDSGAHSTLRGGGRRRGAAAHECRRRPRK